MIMAYFSLYLIKSSICLMLFYTFYRVVLSQETFFKTNRFVLLLIVILSILIPIVKIPLSGLEHLNLEAHGHLSVLDLEVSEPVLSPHKSVGLWSGAFFV